MAPSTVSYDNCIENRLRDVVHSVEQLYLVFEYLDMDLQKFLLTFPGRAMNPHLIKVGEIFPSKIHLL